MLHYRLYNCKKGKVMPKVDIITPAYNTQEYIKDSIDSVLSQTFEDFNFIIINDGSTDDTGSIIDSYDDERIIHIELEENAGIATALNIGLMHTESDFVARFDSDDIMFSDRLEKQLRYLNNHPEVDILGGSMCTYMGKNHTCSQPNVIHDHKRIKTALMLTYPMAHPTIMMRKKVADSFRYDGRFIASEDLEAWTRLIHHFTFANMNENLVHYRMRPDSETSTHIQSDEWVNSIYTIYQNYYNSLGIDDDVSPIVAMKINGKVNNSAEMIFYHILDNYKEFDIDPKLLYNLFYKSYPYTEY